MARHINEAKVSRPVLRGGSGSNVTSLPDRQDGIGFKPRVRLFGFVHNGFLIDRYGIRSGTAAGPFGSGFFVVSFSSCWLLGQLALAPVALQTSLSDEELGHFNRCDEPMTCLAVLPSKAQQFMHVSSRQTGRILVWHNKCSKQFN